MVESATATTVDGIVRGLAELKLGIGRALDEMEAQLTTEARRLADLRQAIEIETRNLEELHQIQAEAGSLAALIAAQEEKRRAFAREIEEKIAAFEAEMQARRAQWKREQEEYERTRKERDEQLRKERAREEEEYDYTLKLTRKKEQDDYAARRAEQEKELQARRATLEKGWAEREAALAAREAELAELRARRGHAAGHRTRRTGGRGARHRAPHRPAPLRERAPGQGGGDRTPAQGPTHRIARRQDPRAGRAHPRTVAQGRRGSRLGAGHRAQGAGERRSPARSGCPSGRRDEMTPHDHDRWQAPPAQAAPPHRRRARQAIWAGVRLGVLLT